jgi:hypothetical protein
MDVPRGMLPGLSGDSVAGRVASLKVSPRGPAGLPSAGLEASIIHNSFNSGCNVGATEISHNCTDKLAVATQ